MSVRKAVLAVDAGNSRIALGCVAGEEVLRTRRVGCEDASAVGEALAELWDLAEGPKVVVASSVNPEALAVVRDEAGRRIDREVLLVGHEVDRPIETNLPDPASVGTDRLCAAAMAYQRLGSACVVADVGTAMTVDCVSDDGVFLGGAILPGLGMGARALASETAVLPPVELQRPDWVFGTDTRQAMVGGLVYGARGSLRELTEAYATELGAWPPLVLTGGDAELVGQGYDIVHAIVPDLCLMGIALAYHLNPPQAT